MRADYPEKLRYLHPLFRARARFLRIFRLWGIYKKFVNFWGQKLRNCIYAPELLKAAVYKCISLCWSGGASNISRGLQKTRLFAIESGFRRVIIIVGV
jgi:hypothetical protein